MGIILSRCTNEKSYQGIYSLNSPNLRFYQLIKHKLVIIWNNMSTNIHFHKYKFHSCQYIQNVFHIFEDKKTVPVQPQLVLYVWWFHNQYFLAGCMETLGVSCTLNLTSSFVLELSLVLALSLWMATFSHSVIFIIIIIYDSLPSNTTYISASDLAPNPRTRSEKP